MSAEKIRHIGSNRGPYAKPTPGEVRHTVNAVCDKYGLMHPTDLHVEDAAPVARRTGRSTSYNQYTRFVKWCAGRAETVGNYLVDHLGFTALRLTAMAVGLATLAGLLAMNGEYAWGTIALVVAGFFEAVDAVAARRSPFDRRDVFLDYISDRFADIAIFGAVALSFLTYSRVVAALSVAVMLISLVSSYARAQAEALRFRSSSKFGRMERVVGAIVLMAGVTTLGGPTATNAQAFATWCLAGLTALSVVTLADRMISVLRSKHFLTLDVAAAWEEGSDLPRLLTDMMEANEKLTVYETSTDAKEIGQLIHIQRTPSGNAVVTFESGVTQRQLRRRNRAS